MKLARLLIILSCCALLLSACDKKQLESHSPQLDDSSDLSGMVMIEDSVNITSYTEYLLYLQFADLPDGFVTYEDYSHLGSFKSFTGVFDVFAQYTQYRYCLVDGSGTELILWVYHDKYEAPEHTLTSTPNPSNMRYLNNEDKGYYLHGDLGYHYIAGGLYNLVWQIGNVSLMLEAKSPTTTERGSSYPNNESTVFGKLLNIQDKTPEEVWKLLTTGE